MNIKTRTLKITITESRPGMETVSFALETEDKVRLNNFNNSVGFKYVEIMTDISLAVTDVGLRSVKFGIEVTFDDFIKHFIDSLNLTEQTKEPNA